MDLSNLKPAKGSFSTKKRLGRGQGSTDGGTAGRGHNGQKSRSGYSKKVGFEGGQMPLQRRVPKFGFKSLNKVIFRGINLDVLQALVEEKKAKKVDKDFLIENGLASKKDSIKILGRGELSAKVEVVADGFTQSAIEAIEKAGGSATLDPKAARKLEIKAAKKAASKKGKKKSPKKATAAAKPKVDEKSAKDDKKQDEAVKAEGKEATAAASADDSSDGKSEGKEESKEVAAEKAK